jgi:biopolymer transport protein ExbB
MTIYPNVIKRVIKSTVKKALTVSALSLSLVSLSSVSYAQEAVSLDDLLNQLAQGNITQTKQNQARESQFKAKVNQQQSMLNDMGLQRDNALVLSVQLEQNFADNEINLANKADALDK